ncbi:hypothetical protein EYZ11_005688 [Aspergillus tanneri]|uniref:Uncharacterized protein n=1 Tax=Aspergillus tanneri TaxID=1220188 RepID=A0A4S3JHA1_9EURO|nr:hypothetical protein EYZ11_005688 [Aspergillus tanneri]
MHQDLDATVKSLGYPGRNGTENVPVETIVSIFQYTLIQVFAHDEYNSYLDPNFDYSWACAAAYYWTGYVYPCSDWSLGDITVYAFDKDRN